VGGQVKNVFQYSARMSAVVFRKKGSKTFVRITKFAGHTTKPVINGVTWLIIMGGKIHHEYQELLYEVVKCRKTGMIRLKA
jgi:hypothetical protein